MVLQEVEALRAQLDAAEPTSRPARRSSNGSSSQGSRRRTASRSRSSS